MKKNKYYTCPVCSQKHKLPKTKELVPYLVACDCDTGIWIQIKNGYHIPSNSGLKKVY